MTCEPSHVAPQPSIDALKKLAQTEAFWIDWIGRCIYQGDWSAAVRRSLITIKAQTYLPTGGIVAASASGWWTT